jgi:hypothetical protein
MGTAINSGAGLIGIPATMSCLALLLIWGLFVLLGIRIRRKWVRISGAMLLGVALSMLLGLSRPDLLQHGYSHGGALGDWIYLNCSLSGLEGFAYFLSWIAVILSLLLATDWLFHEYITDALGIPQPPSPAVVQKTVPSLYPPRVQAPAVRLMSSTPTPVVEERREEETSAVISATEQVEEKGIPVQLEEPSLPTNEWWVAPIKGSRSLEEAVVDPGIEEEGLLLDDLFEQEDPVVGETVPVEAQPQEMSTVPEQEISMDVTDESEVTMQPEASDEESTFYRQAIHLVHARQEASISLLQQSLGLGYFKAAKLIDRLEKDGVISPPSDDGRRTVLITEEQVNGL